MTKRQNNRPETLPDFLRASGKGIGLAERFTAEQILYLHRLHGYLQNEGVLSDLSFEYRHHLCRASFNLSGGDETSLPVSVRLSEHKIAPAQWSYSIDTVVDGILQKSLDYSITLAARGFIDPVMEIASAKIKAENARLYHFEARHAEMELSAVLSRMRLDKS